MLSNYDFVINIGSGALPFEHPLIDLVNSIYSQVFLTKIPLTFSFGIEQTLLPIASSSLNFA